VTDSSSEPRPSRYLDGTQLAAAPDWYESDAAWKAEQVRDMMRKHGMEPGSICDVGCGTGGVLDHLSRTLPPATKLVGYEMSPQAVALAPEARKQRITFVSEWAEESKDGFDLMLVLDVFEHVDDYLGFLRTIREKAGSFIFHIPLDVSVQTVLRASPFTRARESLGHLHYFSRDTALATLHDTGYSIVDEQLTQPSVDLWGGKSRLARLPRKVAFRLNPRLAARVMGGFSLLVLAKPR
jgi:cyclopropane fatty-acyl-phospholipid synthase-like methyltransferase